MYRNNRERIKRQTPQEKEQEEKDVSDAFKRAQQHSEDHYENCRLRNEVIFLRAENQLLQSKLIRIETTCNDHEACGLSCDVLEIINPTPSKSKA